MRKITKSDKVSKHYKHYSGTNNHKYRVEVEFSGLDDDYQSKLEKLVGRTPDGSGYMIATDRRDIEWMFSKFKDAEKVAVKLKKACRPGMTVEVSELFDDGVYRVRKGKLVKDEKPWWSKPKHDLSGVQQKAVAMLKAANYRIVFGPLCTKDDVRREFSCAQREMARRLMMKSTRLTNRAKYTQALVWVQEALEDISVYRVRKGKAVRIPDEWVGKIPHESTKAKRKEFSKLKRKERRRTLRKDTKRALKEQQE